MRITIEGSLGAMNSLDETEIIGIQMISYFATSSELAGLRMASWSHWNYHPSWCDTDCRGITRIAVDMNDIIRTIDEIGKIDAGTFIHNVISQYLSANTRHPATLQLTSHMKEYVECIATTMNAYMCAFTRMLVSKYKSWGKMNQCILMVSPSSIRKADIAFIEARIRKETHCIGLLTIGWRDYRLPARLGQLLGVGTYHAE